MANTPQQEHMTVYQLLTLLNSMDPDKQVFLGLHDNDRNPEELVSCVTEYLGMVVISNNIYY